CWVGGRWSFVCVVSAATGAFVFRTARGISVRVLLEERTLLPGVVCRISTFKGVSTGTGALPTPIRHVLIVSYAAQAGHRLRGIVGDGYASASIFDQLVSFIRLRLVPLVDPLCKGACGLVDSLARICRSTAKNKECCGHGYRQLFKVHGVLPG